MAKFDETPIVKDPAVNGLLRAPDLRENASANVKCWPSKPKDTAQINLPTERVPDWQARGVARLGELLEKNKALRVFMDILRALRRVCRQMPVLSGHRRPA